MKARYLDRPLVVTCSSHQNLEEIIKIETKSTHIASFFLQTVPAFLSSSCHANVHFSSDWSDLFGSNMMQFYWVVVTDSGAQIFFLSPYKRKNMYFWSLGGWWPVLSQRKCVSVCFQDEKVVDGGMLPDANGKDPNPGGQTEGSKWQKPRLSRKSLMKCCLVKWIIASTKQQGPGKTHRIL